MVVHLSFRLRARLAVEPRPGLPVRGEHGSRSDERALRGFQVNVVDDFYGLPGWSAYNHPSVKTDSKSQITDIKRLMGIHAERRDRRCGCNTRFRMDEFIERRGHPVRGICLKSASTEGDHP